MRDLRACAGRLEKALRTGSGPLDLRRFLPPRDAPHRLAVLHELIKTELEHRYLHRHGCLLEDYLRRYTELGRAEDLPAFLLYEEYRVRRRFGENPPLEEYRGRFPRQFEPFQELLRRQPLPEPPAEAANPTAMDTLPTPEPAADQSVEELSNAPPPPLPTPDSERPISKSSRSPSAPKAALLLPGGEGYELLERIGKGTFGEVYRALAPGGVVVAVKRILRELDHESSKRELKALEMVRELRHIYLLQLHNYYPFEDRLIIVTELADGSLEDRFKECRAAGLVGIPEKELLDYFREAAEALDFMAQQNLTHRDIKPQNLLHLKGHAKVADFGVVREQANPLDHTIHIAGTPAYMAPEMFDNDVSVHSDQYSLAVTWYEMRTGRRVFDAKSYVDMAIQHKTAQPDLSGVPEGERQVLSRALAKAPDQRFPSCAAFVAALREVIAPPPKPVPDRGWGFKVASASLAFALTMVLVVLALVFIPPKPRPSEPKPPEPPKPDWQPTGWQPVTGAKLVPDRGGRQYYDRLQRERGGETVVMVVVPQGESDDPATFYIMQTKVWNNLYRAFLRDPKSRELRDKHGRGQGLEELFSKNEQEWEKGAQKVGPNGPIDLGVGEGRLPVFRVTATEAECLAEWLGGRLPLRAQYLKAACLDKLPPPPAAANLKRFGLDLGAEGPLTVDKGEEPYDNEFHCRQLVSNGKEFTRNLMGDPEQLPLRELKPARKVLIVGKRYESAEFPSKDKLQDTDIADLTDAKPEISFRVVLERPEGAP